MGPPRVNAGPAKTCQYASCTFHRMSPSALPPLARAGSRDYGGRMQPDRLVTDASLAHVARRLRLLGYDIDVHRGARLEELIEVALAEDRVVLTRSARRAPKHPGLRIVTLSGVLAEDVKYVADTFTAASAPLRRCTTCNTPLQSRSAFEARGEVPGRVTRAGGPFTFCPGCGRWYWIGSHVRRIREWTTARLGRQLEGTEGTTPAKPADDSGEPR